MKNRDSFEFAARSEERRRDQAVAHWSIASQASADRSAPCRAKTLRQYELAAVRAERLVARLASRPMGRWLPHALLATGVVS